MEAFKNTMIKKSKKPKGKPKRRTQSEIEDRAGLFALSVVIYDKDGNLKYDAKDELRREIKGDDDEV